MRLDHLLHFRRNLLILYWIGMFLMTHWPDIGAYAPDEIAWIPHFDKMVHFGMYLGWTLLWGWLLSSGRRRLSGSLLVRLLIGGAAWAILDELTQALVGRDPSIWDFSCDFAALVIGTLAIWAYQHRWTRRGWGAADVLPAGK